ncbi:hypothetical protein WICPIJ_001406 [Wickerhamomyces pijperi]|uniref:Uncharacterized protein n=1 Tax=Wickerhamomyces pijperi TaxID=599730 RepID=A0A9P8QBQ1_WICPI|nr:hypothetical protein WICPIJ_001406 [Wickerhamomyces pijperi]
MVLSMYQERRGSNKDHVFNTVLFNFSTVSFNVNGLADVAVVTGFGSSLTSEDVVVVEIVLEAAEAGGVEVLVSVSLGSDLAIFGSSGFGSSFFFGSSSILTGAEAEAEFELA